MTRFIFFSSRRRHTRLQGDWSSDVCSSDLGSRVRGAVPLPDREARPLWLLPTPVALEARRGSLELCSGPERKIGRASCREREEEPVMAGAEQKEEASRRQRVC